MKSNFLILMSDEHNPFYSGPYGHKKVKTPNMDKLAKKGTVFDSAYCPSPLCMPSRSSFLSGKRVHELQSYSNCNVHLDPSPLSLGKALADQGVFSVFIGKCDAYASAKEMGFSAVMNAWDRKTPGDTNHRRNPLFIRPDAARRSSGYGPKDNAGSDDMRCIDLAIEWLKTTAKNMNTPWALVVNVTNPHFPHFSSQELWDMYPDGGDMHEHGADSESGQHPYAKSLKKHFQTEGFTEEQIRGLRRGYLACISFVDHQLGRLMETLDSTGMSANTNIAYTSDHGEMLGKFGMWWKCSLYEDSVRIPMIAAGPDFKAGSHVSTPVDLHDLRAGMFTSTGAKQPSGWLGTPLQAISQHDDTRVVFAEYHGHGTPGSSFMIRKGRWKYVWHAGAPAQLFDLGADPDELANLAIRKKEIANEMEAELRKICSPEKENERAESFIEEQLMTINGTIKNKAS